MRIRSFYHDGVELKTLDVEIALWPGLPTIQFVGQADQHLRESALRIKSAIKASGYEFPIAQQILVNLKPTHIRKSSRGLELAVTLGYLWLTGQIPDLILNDQSFIYGELGLNGEVEEPADLIQAALCERDYVITGVSSRSEAGNGRRLFRRKLIRHLRDYGDAEECLADSVVEGLQRPGVLGPDFLSESEARFLKLVAIGGHHALLAGPSGSGKTTLARALHGLMPDLAEAEALEIRQLSENDSGAWRPLVDPHHATPRAAMIGGGNPPRPGEIARAHLGLLILDEFLEFDSEVLESLREPIEQGELRVGRLGAVRSFKVRAQICATTNLCPCGDWVPGKSLGRRCRFSLKKCRSYSERLSGPLLDRFQVLYFSRRNEKREIPMDQVLAEVLRIHEWQRQVRGHHLTRRLDLKSLWTDLEASAQKVGFSAQNLSERRRLAALRVARSLADIEFEPHIGLRHLDEALTWAVHPFQSLNRWQFELEY